MSALMRLMTTANAAADGGSTGPTSYRLLPWRRRPQTLASAPAPAANVAASLAQREHVACDGQQPKWAAIGAGIAPQAECE